MTMLKTKKWNNTPNKNTTTNNKVKKNPQTKISMKIQNKLRKTQTLQKLSLIAI